jgi:hypothetical protein
MRDFLVILIVAIILFGVVRRMIFGSFYAAFDKFQKEQDRKEQEEKKRKASGKTYIDKTGSSSYIKGNIEDVDYEEVK